MRLPDSRQRHQRALLRIACIALTCAGATARAASFGAEVNPHGDWLPFTEWNPRQAAGLITVASKALDVTDSKTWSDDYGQHSERYDYAAAAAAYGGDTSAGHGALNPKMLGLVVEPMADAMAHQSRACTHRSGDNELHDCYTPTSDADASAWITVAHRIVQRGNAPLSQQTFLDSLNAIPVVLDYRLSASTDSATGSYASGAAAGFSISLESGVDLFWREACAGKSPGCAVRGEASSEVAGSWSTTLAPTAADRVVTYSISAGASAWAHTANYEVSSASSQAVADPFLHIDPAWAYAPYFMVQQASLETPGTWIEVSRAWVSAPVPEPSAWALMLAGLAVLAGTARRCDRAR